MAWHMTSVISPDLASIDMPLPVAVVCHDAGAANVLVAELAYQPTWTVLPVMHGPAVKVWRASASESLPLLELEAALARARLVVTGTGWASNLEHEARCRAIALRLPTVAVLDHWVNYRERFEHEGQVMLPDEIWVTDAYALKIATDLFPSTIVRQRPNHYLRDQVSAIHRCGRVEAGRVLYVLEPLRYVWPGLTRAGEFEALDYLIRRIKTLTGCVSPCLWLRPHPSEQLAKYQPWLGNHHGIEVAMDDSNSLADAIGRAEWVVGCETAAMVIALAAGKRVASTLPPAAPRCRLPHQGLVHLRDLAETGPQGANPG